MTHRPYDTTEGDKQRCRDVLIAAVKEYLPAKGNKRFFLLPGEFAHDAHTLRKEWPNALIEGVERDKGTHAKIEDSHPFHVKNLTIREFIDSERRWLQAGRNVGRFDMAFLDYLGPCTVEKLTEAADFVSTLAKDKFVLGLTFQVAYRYFVDDRQDVAERMLTSGLALTEGEEKSVFVKREGKKIVPLGKEWLDGPVPTSAVTPGAWQSATNIADLACSYIERDGDVASLRILDAFDYRSQEGSQLMHYAAIYVEKNGLRHEQ